MEADENQMCQIVWNLATNALRAMPDGGRLGLSVDGASDGDVILRVSDDGVGIPAAEVEKVFQPFRGTFGQGTGLGLAIVHRVVNDHGGDVRVHSAEGVGTTVEVQLPARPRSAVPRRMRRRHTDIVVFNIAARQASTGDSERRMPRSKRPWPARAILPTSLVTVRPSRSSRKESVGWHRHVALCSSPASRGLARSSSRGPFMPTPLVVRSRSSR